MLTEDLQMLEKRVDLVKQVCHTLVKKLQTCSQSQSGDFERRLVGVTVGVGVARSLCTISFCRLKKCPGKCVSVNSYT